MIHSKAEWQPPSSTGQEEGSVPAREGQGRQWGGSSKHSGNTVDIVSEGRGDSTSKAEVTKHEGGRKRRSGVWLGWKLEGKYQIRLEEGDLGRWAQGMWVLQHAPQHSPRAWPACYSRGSRMLVNSISEQLHVRTPLAIKWSLQVGASTFFSNSLHGLEVFYF